MDRLWAGSYTTIGIKSDRKVVPVGYNEHGQYDLSPWAGIVQVGAGRHHSLGLKPHGTAVEAGNNSWDQRNVDTWDLNDGENQTATSRQSAYARFLPMRETPLRTNRLFIRKRRVQTLRPSPDLPHRLDLLLNESDQLRSNDARLP